MAGLSSKSEAEVRKNVGYSALWESSGEAAEYPTWGGNTTKTTIAMRTSRKEDLSPVFSLKVAHADEYVKSTSTTFLIFS